MHRAHENHSQHRFTLIEIAAVLMLIGVLAAAVAPRLGDSGSDAAAAINSLKVHLRYAQLRAMADTESWGIGFTGTSYTLLRDGSPAALSLPGQDSNTQTVTGVTISPTTTVSFSPGLGQPSPDNGHTITVGTQSLSITAETGFIP
jgi:MSHA pilin protein MshC